MRLAHEKLLLLTSAFCLLFALCENHGVASKANQSFVPSLKQQVISTLNKIRAAKGNDYNLRVALVSKGAVVLPILEEYIGDPNPDVRYAVLNVAEHLPSAAANNVIVNCVASSDLTIATSAVRLLFQRRIGSNQYHQTTPIVAQNQALRNNLMVYLRRNPTNPYAVMLISSYEGDQLIVSFLHQLRLAYPKATVSFYLQERDADFEVLVDVSLARLGDKEAVNKLQEKITDGKISNLLLMLDVVGYIDDKTILSSLVDLLKDQRGTHFSAAHLIDGPEDPSVPRDLTERICDIALIYLQSKANIDVGVPRASKISPYVFSYIRFTDDELSRARYRLKNALSP